MEINAICISFVNYLFLSFVNFLLGFLCFEFVKPYIYMNDNSLTYGAIPSFLLTYFWSTCWKIVVTIPAFANLYRWLFREMDPDTSWLYTDFCMDVIFFWFSPPPGSCLIYSCLRSAHTVSQMTDSGQVETNHLPSPLPNTLNIWSW